LIAVNILIFFKIIECDLILPPRLPAWRLRLI